MAYCFFSTLRCELYLSPHRLRTTCDPTAPAQGAHACLAKKAADGYPTPEAQDRHFEFFEEGLFLENPSNLRDLSDLIGRSFPLFVKLIRHFPSFAQKMPN